MEADDLALAVQDAAVAGPGAAQRDRNDLAHRGDAVAVRASSDCGAPGEHLVPDPCSVFYDRRVPASSGVRAARVYDDPQPGDGARVLVDGLWPRGLSKEAAALDEWCKAIAPSTELRNWYRHDPARAEEFEARYRAELEEPERAAALAALRERREREAVTLLTATGELDLSHAALLARLL